MDMPNEAKMLKETKRYSAAKKDLDVFREKLKKCTAQSFREFKEAFRSADRVGDKTIEVSIDICGNNYRLIVENFYESQRTYYVEFMTHKDYTRKYSS
jgi:mRNA-degrading endonuclease HigB of HigAB toxin-antitoxin module